MKKTIMMVTILIAASWIIPFTSDRVLFDLNSESSPTEAPPEWMPSMETWVISLGCTMGLMIIGLGFTIKKFRLNQDYSKIKATSSSADNNVEDLSDSLSGISSSSLNGSNFSASTDYILQDMLNLQVQNPLETTGDFNPIEIGSANLEKKNPSDSKNSKKTNKNRKS